MTEISWMNLKNILNKKYEIDMKLRNRLNWNMVLEVKKMVNSWDGVAVDWNRA